MGKETRIRYVYKTGARWEPKKTRSLLGRLGGSALRPQSRQRKAVNKEGGTQVMARKSEGGRNRKIRWFKVKLQPSVYTSRAYLIDGWPSEAYEYER